MSDRATSSREDERARFEELYRAYSGSILAYAARRVASADEAADVVAETFTTAWRRIGQVPSGAETRPWLYGVAKNVLRNHHRRDHRQSRLTRRLATDVGTLIEHVAAAGADHPDMHAVALAFGKLRQEDRELLSLVGWEGLDRDAIATMLGCSRAVVRVRLHRARRRFELALEAAGVQRVGTYGHELVHSPAARADRKEAL